MAWKGLPTLANFVSAGSAAAMLRTADGTGSSRSTASPAAIAAFKWPFTARKPGLPGACPAFCTGRSGTAGDPCPLLTLADAAGC